MESKSELEKLVQEIKEETNQISVNKIDEVRVMKCMLNDPDFSIGVYDKNKGYIGQRCPHEEAVKFTKNIISETTGLDSKNSRMLAENYEYSNRDATFLLNNMRDFMTVYTGTGRKINILQTECSEAYLHTKQVGSRTLTVPDRENKGCSKQIETLPYTKLVSINKCPKYMK